MKKIPLTQDKVALVDDADFDWLNQWKWQAVRQWRRNRWVYYAVRTIANPNRPGKQTTCYMHKFIFGPSGGLDMDHRDGNGLNNQRKNFRPATKSQNAANSALRANNKSGFKGVSFSAARNRWLAQIGVQGRKLFLGRFDSAEDAARAYDRAAQKFFGEFSLINLAI